MDFNTAIGRTLGIEGNYQDGNGDPGGETNFGISKRSYPNVDIKNLTRDDAVAIYRRDFWEQVHADTLPGPLAYQALDFAVNSGISTAIRKLQYALGVADDGHWGPVTQHAADVCFQPVVIMRFLAARLRFMRGLTNWPTAGRGWAERISADLEYAAADLL